jgi:hypothetical protein
MALAAVLASPLAGAFTPAPVAAMTGAQEAVARAIKREQARIMLMSPAARIQAAREAERAAATGKKAGTKQAGVGAARPGNAYVRALAREAAAEAAIAKRAAKQAGKSADASQGARLRVPGDVGEPGGRQGDDAVSARDRAAEPAGASVLAPDVRVNDPGPDLLAGSGQAEVLHAMIGNDVVAAWNDGDGFGGGQHSPHTQGFGTSTDGGLTWVDRDAPAALAGWTWTSDPVVVANTSTGDFWYCGLVNPSGTTNGVGVVRGNFSGANFNWQTPELAVSAPNSTTFIDKQWLAVDPASGNLYLTYTVFKDTLIAGQGTVTIDWIEFKRRVSGVWQNPIRLSRPLLPQNGGAWGLVQGSRPVVGPDGEVYVTYYEIGLVDADFMVVHKSTNGGASFGAGITGASFMANFGTGAPGFNRERGISFPSIAVDRTNGPNRGRVYLTWNETVNWFDDNLGGLPTVAESEPNDAPGTGDPFTPGADLTGSFSTANDFDYFAFNATAGTTYIFWCNSPPAIPYTMRIFCTDGVTRLAFSGNTLFGGVQGFIVWTAPANGTYTLRMAPIGGTGSYTILSGTDGGGPERGRDARDVFVNSSANGTTWTTPVRVNDSAIGFDDWLPEVAVSGDFTNPSGTNNRVYVAWYDWRDSPAQCGGRSHVYLSRSDDAGANWVSLGAASSVQSDWTNVSSNIAPNEGDYMSLIADGSVVYPMWSDGRDGNPNIYGAPIPLLATPTQIALVSVSAASDRVTLRWHAAATDPVAAEVQRRVENGAWLTLGETAISGTGDVEWVDDEVTPGARYQYRLALREPEGVRFAGETWVDVPATLALAIERIGPNPADRNARVTFTLPTGAAARLDVVDLAGRVIESREVGNLGPGRHVVQLSRGPTLPAGVYVLRLTQAGRTVTDRVSVVH